MNIEKIIDIIVKEVIDRIREEFYVEDKNALILFTGGNIGVESAIENIKKLIDNGWKLKVVLSKNADFVLGYDYLKKKIGIEDVFVEGKIRDIKYLKQDISKIIIPVLTINSASKVALGISDTLITYLISWGIMKGIPIIAAKDACDPDNSIRLEKAPLDYRNMIKNNLKRLENYNIKFTSAENLYDDVIDSFKGDIRADIVNMQSNKELDFSEKRLITVEDVIKAKGKYREILVSKNTIITALAKDTAHSMGVNIKVKGGL